MGGSGMGQMDYTWITNGPLGVNIKREPKLILEAEKL
jgi:hypothetical protein